MQEQTNFTYLVFSEFEIILSDRSHAVTAPANVHILNPFYYFSHLTAEDWRPWLAWKKGNGKLLVGQFNRDWEQKIYLKFYCTSFHFKRDHSIDLWTKLKFNNPHSAWARKANVKNKNPEFSKLDCRSWISSLQITWN